MQQVGCVGECRRALRDFAIFIKHKKEHYAHGVLFHVSGVKTENTQGTWDHKI